MGGYDDGRLVVGVWSILLIDFTHLSNVVIGCQSVSIPCYDDGVSLLKVLVRIWQTQVE